MPEAPPIEYLKATGKDSVAKPKKPPSESSSSSSSSDKGEGEREEYRKNNLKERELVRPNLRENVLDTDYIKRCLAETDNGTQFGKLMMKKRYVFTKIHTMEARHGDEDVYEMLKEYGCLPVPDGMQCPYCDWNRYSGSR
jgi:hypothetical protein